MSGDLVIVFALIGAAVVLMASNRVRFDIVALLVVITLILTGVLSVGEALSGFGSSVVINVAGLLVIGEMLDRTGVARSVGDLILKHGGTNEKILLILIMAGAALLGSVMSSTAIVAVFIPIVFRISAETNINVSRMLMPMSYAALISGMLTLIATTPNIVVHGELISAGFAGFDFFSFTLLGLIVLVVGVIYILLVRKKFFPDTAPDEAGGIRTRSMREIWQDFGSDEKFDTLEISSGSSLSGLTIIGAQLGSVYNIRIIGLMRKDRQGQEQIVAAAPEVQLQEGNVLLVLGDPESKDRLIKEQGLDRVKLTESSRKRWMWELGIASILIHPESEYIGQTLHEINFRSLYNLNVVGIRHGKKPVGDYLDRKLDASCILLVAGSWRHIQQLKSLTHDFIIMELPAEQRDIVPAYRRRTVALLILGVMVLLNIFDMVPLTAAVLIAALGAVITRCLSMEDAYNAIHWSSIVLLAGMLPLADALDKTGGTKLIVDTLMAGGGDAGPRVMLTTVFFMTSVLGLFLSNTVAAVLMAPIAIGAAQVLNVSPYPFAVAVLISASAAFVTPVSTPVVALVVEPGRYSFFDFVRVGLPLLILTYVVAVVVIPLLFPF